LTSLSFSLSSTTCLTAVATIFHFIERTVHDPDGFVSEREVSSTPALTSTSPPAHLFFSPIMATSQTATFQTIHPCYPSSFGFSHLGHPMGVHSQAFSDICFYTHRPLTSFPLPFQSNKKNSIRVSGAFFLSTYLQFSYTLFVGEEF
jgi:hypothetical protein